MATWKGHLAELGEESTAEDARISSLEARVAVLEAELESHISRVTKSSNLKY